MWDWLGDIWGGISDFGSGLWDQVPEWGDVFSSTPEYVGPYSPDVYGDIASGSLDTSTADMIRSNLGSAGDAYISSNGQSLPTGMGGGTSWWDSFQKGLFSPQALAAGATILGGSYMQNKQLEEAKKSREEDRLYATQEKQLDREFQERMLKEKINAEMEAAAMAAEEAKKMARYNAMVRAAENQAQQAAYGSQGAARALADLGTLAARPLGR